MLPYIKRCSIRGFEATFFVDIFNSTFDKAAFKPNNFYLTFISRFLGPKCSRSMGLLVNSKLPKIRKRVAELRKIHNKPLNVL